MAEEDPGGVGERDLKRLLQENKSSDVIHLMAIRIGYDLIHVFYNIGMWSIIFYLKPQIDDIL